MHQHIFTAVVRHSIQRLLFLPAYTRHEFLCWFMIHRHRGLYFAYWYSLLHCWFSFVLAFFFSVFSSWSCLSFLSGLHLSRLESSDSLPLDAPLDATLATGYVVAGPIFMAHLEVTCVGSFIGYFIGSFIGYFLRYFLRYLRPYSGRRHWNFGIILPLFTIHGPLSECVEATGCGWARALGKTLLLAKENSS